MQKSSTANATIIGGWSIFFSQPSQHSPFIQNASSFKVIQKEIHSYRDTETIRKSQHCNGQPNQVNGTGLCGKQNLLPPSIDNKHHKDSMNKIIDKGTTLDFIYFVF